MAYLRATLLGLLGLVIWPSLAAAHAFLEKSAPDADAVLDQAPASVQLWFSRAVEPSFSSIRVVNSAGKEVNNGKAAVSDSDPKLIAVNLQPLAAGKYKVIWRIVALDGHKAKGEFAFSVK
jgi:methionine-rich copper-binding protein CopC